MKILLSIVIVMITFSSAHLFAREKNLMQSSALNVASLPDVPFRAGEKLNYDIFYHWGIIWKRAGEGVLCVNFSDYKGQPAYRMNLYGKTLNFADKIMQVRDTLDAYTTLDLSPLYYSKTANEGKWWGKDELKYHYKGEHTHGKTTIHRKNREPRDTTVKVLGPGFDMLTVFYFLRNVDFSKMIYNESIQIPIFTGRKVVKMNVKYRGKGKVSLRNKKQYESIQLYLSFINDNNLKESDDPISVWLSDDGRRVPLKVEGKLPIGSLQAEIRE